MAGVLGCILDKGPPNLGFAASRRKKKTKRPRKTDRGIVTERNQERITAQEQSQ